MSHILNASVYLVKHLSEISRASGIFVNICWFRKYIKYNLEKREYVSL